MLAAGDWPLVINGTLPVILQMVTRIINHQVPARMVSECFYIFMGQLPQQAVKIADSTWSRYFNRDIITAQMLTIMTFAMSHIDTLNLFAQ